MSVVLAVLFSCESKNFVEVVHFLADVSLLSSYMMCVSPAESGSVFQRTCRVPCRSSNRNRSEHHDESKGETTKTSTREGGGGGGQDAKRRVGGERGSREEGGT